MSELTKEEVAALEDGVLDMMMAFSLQPDSTKALRELCQKVVNLDSTVTELREERDYQQRKIERLILELTEAEQERDHWKAVAEVLAQRKVRDYQCPTLEIRQACKHPCVDCDKCWIKWAEDKVRSKSC